MTGPTLRQIRNEGNEEMKASGPRVSLRLQGAAGSGTQGHDMATALAAAACSFVCVYVCMSMYTELCMAAILYRLQNYRMCIRVYVCQCLSVAK